MEESADEVTVSEGSEGTLGSDSNPTYSGGILEGQIFDSHKRPLQDVIVMIMDGPSHKDIGAVTDEQGRYRFDDLTNGSYSVMANSETHGQKSQQVVISRARPSRLDFILAG